MVRPNIDFPKALDNLLARVWQVSGDHLDSGYLRKTAEAVVDVRTIYRNKGEKLIGEKIKRYSQSIDFSQRRYRAGYIASFGERHAYLTYYHLKRIEKIDPNVIPLPQNGELTVTVVGAGAALELFGLCYYYNEKKSRIRKLKINFIERISDWQSDRDSVIERIIKETFHKLQIFKEDINVNLVQDNVMLLSQKYDNLVKSDIILVYNVLNEITTYHNKMVWKNLEYILKICGKRILILLMEPSAKYTRPRVQPIIDQLSKCTKIILKSNEEEFLFNSPPLKIECIDNDSFNFKLFKNITEGHRPPTFENSLKRMHLACVVDPLSPISIFDAERQYRNSTRERDDRNRFKKPKEQSSFNDLDSSFGTQNVIRKYINES